MDRRVLENYRVNKRLVDRNNKKIDEEKMREIQIVKGKVRGSSPEFPYTEQRFTVQMDEPQEAERKRQRIELWQAANKTAVKEIAEAEAFIAGISDVMEREIFTYRYIDGLRLEEIGAIVGYTKGRISQIISKILKD